MGYGMGEEKKMEKETKARGEWRHLPGYNYIAGKLVSYDKYKCSECGCVRDKKYSICPNCGIKMGVIKMRLINGDALLERIENWKRKYMTINAYTIDHVKYRQWVKR